MNFDYFIAGLGNPGIEYAQTRHNLGFMFIDLMARNAEGAQDFRDRNLRLKAETKEILWCERKILLVKPRTFMNNSGEALSALVNRFKPALEKIFVIYDDLDIPLGTVRLRKKGSAGTHRGMASILASLKDENFPRIRLGIGPKPDGIPAEKFVLQPFGKNEKLKVEEMLLKAKKTLGLTLLKGIDHAISKASE